MSATARERVILRPKPAKSKIFRGGGINNPDVSSLGGPDGGTQHLKHAEHFSSWNDEKVAKSIQCGEPILFGSIFSKIHEVSSISGKPTTYLLVWNFTTIPKASMGTSLEKMAHGNWSGLSNTSQDNPTLGIKADFIAIGRVDVKQTNFS
jgi:hypothetical protein